MKIFVKIVLGIVAVIVLTVSAVFFMTSGMSDTADKFFKAVKSQNIDEAYTYLSEDFKKNTNKQDLNKFLSDNSFDKYKDASWNNRSISGSRGELSGSIMTDNGGAIPVTVFFVKAEDEWKIYSIRKPSSGLKQETKSIEMPSERQQIKLVSDTLAVFSQSISDQSMAKLNEYSSILFQKEVGLEKLDKVYESFFKFGDKLMVINKHAPIFSEQASLNKDNVMLLKGVIPTKPDQVFFELKYVFEGLGWKLLGIKINIRK